MVYIASYVDALFFFGNWLWVEREHLTGKYTSSGDWSGEKTYILSLSFLEMQQFYSW